MYLDRAWDMDPHQDGHLDVRGRQQSSSSRPSLVKTEYPTSLTPIRTRSASTPRRDDGHAARPRAVRRTEIDSSRSRPRSIGRPTHWTYGRTTSPGARDWFCSAQGTGRRRTSRPISSRPVVRSSPRSFFFHGSDGEGERRHPIEVGLFKNDPLRSPLTSSSSGLILMGSPGTDLWCLVSGSCSGKGICCSAVSGGTSTGYGFVQASVLLISPGNWY